MLWLILLFLFILGAMSGSFALASVWRMRADQLVAEKRYRDADYKRLVKVGGLADVSAKRDRSHCLSCGYVLRWYDLIPVLSWVFLGGRCRHCRAPIGALEVVTEVVLGGIFVLSYLFWPLGFAGWLESFLFGAWIAWLLVATILFIYDLKWMELPVGSLYLLVAVSALFMLAKIMQVDFSLAMVLEYILALVALSGTYWFLHAISKGRWVGSGDAFVGAAIALILGDWRLALIALFLANLFGVVAVLPSIINKKIGFSSRIPMGPLLILAGLVAFWFSQNLLSFFAF